VFVGWEAGVDKQELSTYTCCLGPLSAGYVIVWRLSETKDLAEKERVKAVERERKRERE
jgi:hypothetical protein